MDSSIWQFFFLQRDHETFDPILSALDDCLINQSMLVLIKYILNNCFCLSPIHCEQANLKACIHLVFKCKGESACVDFAPSFITAQSRQVFSSKVEKQACIILNVQWYPIYCRLEPLTQHQIYYLPRIRA